jgi:uncharacterized NAD(P)/FAD-binding protein YdhS
MNLDQFTVAVVGVGAAGVSMVTQLVACFRDAGIRGARIIAFESSPRFGPGVAYQADSEVAILNRTAANMSAVMASNDHFANWLTAAGHPAALLNDYVPRPLFGNYLASTLASAGVQAKLDGNEVLLVAAQMVAIVDAHGRFQLHSEHATWQADRVVLCTGNLATNHYRHLLGTANYFHSPYPLSQALGRLKPDQRVAVIGSRLSAVDVLAWLTTSGHTGPVSLLSRQGYLPSVQYGQENTALAYCTRERIARLAASAGGRLSYRTVLRIVLKELSLACGYRFSAKYQKPKGADPVAIFRRDVQRAKQGAQPWQSAFVALNDVISELWHVLDARDREKFRTQDFSRFMALRVPIPARNAVKVLELFDSGRLDMHAGLDGVTHKENAFHATFKSSTLTKTFDVVINCTGSDNDVTRTSDPLYRQLIDSGLLAPHPQSGVAVDFATNVAVARNGKQSHGMYVVGNMTSGTYLFCSVLELNARHCQRVSQHITDDMLGQRQRERTAGGGAQPYADAA